ncbi:hypothetical protein EVG20_g3095 [Dentipellis fragilis]|uniref:Uncharacterized protein n=1 Tax=Dentipellis fragilis TaxID=205917 RepID=A0A4Y9Z4I5_9AGAM|nr:hypothetical protein EVG20_g3095 [Dentipellis fragilis]
MFLPVILLHPQIPSIPNANVPSAMKPIIKGGDAPDWKNGGAPPIVPASVPEGSGAVVLEVRLDVMVGAHGWDRVHSAAAHTEDRFLGTESIMANKVTR